MAREKYISMESRLSISSTNAVFKRFGDESWHQAAVTIRQVGDRAWEFARQNVAPGEGPGPHPHIWPHDDTGDLQEDIGLKFKYEGSRLIAVVYTEKDYGAYLEVGWQTPTGRRVHYPWLKPAYKKAGQGFLKAATDNWRRALRSVATKDVIMDSKAIDDYGAQVIELMKPLDGWKNLPPSTLPPEFLAELIQGEREPQNKSTRRTWDAKGGKRLAELSRMMHAQAKGKSHAGKSRHRAYEDNQNYTAAAKRGHVSTRQSPPSGRNAPVTNRFGKNVEKRRKDKPGTGQTASERIKKLNKKKNQ